MTWDVFPVQGYKPLSEGIGAWANHLVLPSLTLGLSFMALIARITRASVLEVLSQDYIRTARSKGLGDRQLLLDHALANAAVPIVTIIGVGRPCCWVAWSSPKASLPFPASAAWLSMRS